MLYLHPSQREYVAKDYSGPAKLAGVSGSGKTCVIVHRALRLADMYIDEPILIVTLSVALASLINRLINAARGDLRPKNLTVLSIFDLCYEKLLELEPQKKDYYTKRTITKNPHAISEHIDDIWNEYFLCQNNNFDADKMFDVVQTLSVRGVFSSDYLRQEIDYIRSGFRPDYRVGYLKMERDGRVVPLEERYRLAILDGLDGWEKKMKDVGAVDDMGIVTALSKHIEFLKPVYRCVLVDEVQDLGTLELSIIRKLTRSGENDLFLCGDAAQTIYTKSSDLKNAEIDVSDRTASLKQNYRNSRQILTSAHAVLTRSLETIPKCALHLEVLPPEYANFSSPNPLLLKAESILQELSYAISYLNDLMVTANQNQRFCIAFCGYSHAAVEVLGGKLNISVLSATSNIRASRIFMSDLEQTKGFEFDVVVVVNCTSSVMPHPILPDEESFRDLSRLYVAMTRAKTQLLVSYHGTPSKFIEVARDTFTEGNFLEHAELTDGFNVDFPAPSIPELRNPDVWSHSAKPFLKSRDAVGLSRPVQDAILSRVTGKDLLRGLRHKQMEWKSFGAFLSSMQSPNARNQVISPEAWQALNTHLGQQPKVALTVAVTDRLESVITWDDDRGLNQQSPLFKMGYRVTVNGPTTSRRRTILSQAFDEACLPGLVSDDDKNKWGTAQSAQRLYAMSKFLTWLCEFQGSDKHVARQYWVDDLAWLKKQYFRVSMRFSWPNVDAKELPHKRHVPNTTFMSALTLSPELAAVVGAPTMPRTEVISELWKYIKKNNLQDESNKQTINADTKLKKIFGKEQISMFDMAGLIGKHVR